MNSINREIIRLSVPTVISNITIPLLGIADTAISGHLGSELFLSAIAVGSVMLNVVFWIFGFLRGGTTGIAANALGAGIEREIARVLYRSLLIAATAGALLIILQRPIFKGLWWITGGGKEILTYVEEYFTIRVLGAPALLAVIAVSGWFVGMQNTFYPMLIAIATNLFNIALSYTLAFQWGYGFNGVALGTLISNWLGLLVAFSCLLWFWKGKILKCSLATLIKGEWWRYFSVNSNLFLRSLFIICVTMGVTAAGARINALTLAVNVIVMQFFQFFSFFMDGFAYSGEAMVGLRWGEKNFRMLHLCVKHLMRWTLGTGIMFSLIYFCGIGEITSLLTDSQNVIEGVTDLTLWVSLIPILSCWAFIYDGLYIGITDTFQMMLSTLIGALIFFLILFTGPLGGQNLSPDLGSHGTIFTPNSLIWTAFLAYLLFRGLYLALLWRKSIKSPLIAA